MKSSAECLWTFGTRKVTVRKHFIYAVFNGIIFVFHGYVSNILRSPFLESVFQHHDQRREGHIFGLISSPTLIRSVGFIFEDCEDRVYEPI